MDPLDKKHITSEYDEELQQITKKLIKMYSMAEQQIQDSLDNIAKNDVKMAKKIIQKDQDINNIQVEIQDVCILIITKRQPKASDLRLIIAYFTVLFEIERIADVARKISIIPTLENNLHYKPVFNLIENSGNIALSLFNQSMDAFLRMDLNDSIRLYPTNKPLQENIKLAEELIIKLINTNKTDIRMALDILNVIRAIGKINNRCQSICELVVYYQLGENVKYRDNKEILSLIKEQKITTE